MTKFVLPLILSAAVCAPAQDWAKLRLDKSPRHSEWVSVKHGDRSVETFVVYPESQGKTPVIVLIHEIFGHTDWVREVSDELAGAGYIVLAPDLLSGAGPNGQGSKAFDQSGAVQAVSHLDPEQITADLNAVADYGLRLPASNRELFVIGFCWGGGQSFRFATNRPDLRAAFVFYGPPPDKDAMARIRRRSTGFMPAMMPELGPPFPTPSAK